MDLDRQSWTKQQATPGQSSENLSWRRHHLILMGVAFALFVVLAVRFGPALWALVRDEVALETFIARLGWFGPVALIALNALQIVIAPVPGYFMQLAAGYLYGPVWGGIWGALGLLSGSMLAMWLSRTFGRPFVTRLVGAARLQKWEHVTHSDSALLWLILILTPTGDLPYFLAGLSHVRYSTIILLTLLIRVPTTFVVAAAGAGVLLLSGLQLALAVGVLVLILLSYLRYQSQVTAWIDQYVSRRARPARPHVRNTTPDADLADVA